MTGWLDDQLRSWDSSYVACAEVFFFKYCNTYGAFVSLNSDTSIILCRYLSYWNQGRQCLRNWAMNLKSNWLCKWWILHNILHLYSWDYLFYYIETYICRLHKEHIEKWQEEIKELRLLNDANEEAGAILHNARFLLQNPHIDSWR